MIRLVLIARAVLDAGAAVGFYFADKKMALMFAGFLVADIAFIWSAP